MIEFKFIKTFFITIFYLKLTQILHIILYKSTKPNVSKNPFYKLRKINKNWKYPIVKKYKVDENYNFTFSYKKKSLLKNIKWNNYKIV